MMKSKNKENNISSLFVGKYLDIPHYQVLNSIKEYIDDADNDLFTKEELVISSFIDEIDNQIEYYLINQDQFIFIAMSSTGDNAEKFKQMFMSRFSDEELQDFFNKFTESSGYFKKPEFFVVH